MRLFLFVAVCLSLCLCAKALSLTTFRAEFIPSVNALRKSRGLSLLKESNDLNISAQKWAQNLATLGYIQFRPNPQGSWATGNWIWQLIGQMRSGDYTSTKQAFDAWKSNGLTLAILLKPGVNYVGLGKAKYDSTNGYVSVAEFQ